MAEPLSIDLRTRVVDAVIGGMSRRQAAVHFKVGTSSAIRWVARALTTGDIAPKPQGGDRRSAAIEAEADFILSLLGAGGDATLAEMCAALAAKGCSFSTSALSRFFARRGITLKKVRARGRARAAGYPEASPGVVQNATRSRSGKARLHRRAVGFHEHVAKIWSRPARRTSACGDPSRLLENNDIRGWTETPLVFDGPTLRSSRPGSSNPSQLTVQNAR